MFRLTGQVEGAPEYRVSEAALGRRAGRKPSPPRPTSPPWAVPDQWWPQGDSNPSVIRQIRGIVRVA